MEIFNNIHNMFLRKQSAVISHEAFAVDVRCRKSLTAVDLYDLDNIPSGPASYVILPFDVEEREPLSDVARTLWALSPDDLPPLVILYQRSSPESAFKKSHDLGHVLLADFPVLSKQKSLLFESKVSIAAYDTMCLPVMCASQLSPRASEIITCSQLVRFEDQMTDILFHDWMSTRTFNSNIHASDDNRVSPRQIEFEGLVQLLSFGEETEIGYDGHRLFSEVPDNIGTLDFVLCGSRQMIAQSPAIENVTAKAARVRDIVDIWNYFLSDAHMFVNLDYRDDWKGYASQLDAVDKYLGIKSAITAYYAGTPKAYIIDDN